jgi:hypothetical protein
MRKITLSLVGFAAVASAALAGTETYSGKEMRQTAVAPEECWYADHEINVSLWGTYIFTDTNWERDRYLQADHVWGGGGDVKYFMFRYFGLGVEGWAGEAERTHFDVTPAGGVFEHQQDRTVGSVLGTFTIRYPIGCSRFAPYAWAGGGGIFGGGERDSAVTVGGTRFVFDHGDGESLAVGQFGGGFEVRITRHIGLMNDFSWNVVDGPHNNFGMVRSGLTFSF